MVSASIAAPTLPWLCEGSEGASGRGGEHARARLALLLVQPHDGARGVVGTLEAGDDVRRAHLVVALPRRVDVDLGADVAGRTGLVGQRRLAVDMARRELLGIGRVEVD